MTTTIEATDSTSLTAEFDKTHKVTQSATITDQQIADILCACFEGGSNYWIHSVKRLNPIRAGYLSDMLAKGSELSIAEIDEDKESGIGKSHVLTTQKMLRGIAKAADFYGKSIASYIENHDGDSADVALQFAIFE